MTATVHVVYFTDLCVQTFSESSSSRVPWTSLDGKLRSRLVRQASASISVADLISLHAPLSSLNSSCH